MSEDEEALTFETHNAMSRVAMFCGIPLFPLIFLVIGLAVSLFAGIYFWGWWGLCPPVPFLLAMIGLRMICERDDKAMRRFFFHRRRYWMNWKYGRHLLITPRHAKWREKYARRIIKKHLLAGKS